MLDPISFCVGLGFLLGSAYAGFSVGKQHEQDHPTTEAQKKLREELSRVKKKFEQAVADCNFNSQLCESRTQSLALVTKQRDDYRKIAETHDVNGEKTITTKIEKNVWNNRIYGGHPKDNLDALEKDLIALVGDNECDITVELVKWASDCDGGWGHAGRQNHKFVRSGTVARVIYELRFTLMSPVNGLAYKVDGKLKWVTDDAPYKFFVTLDIIQPAKKVTNTQVIEVLKVQEMLKEVVIEKVVYHTPDTNDELKTSVDPLALLEEPAMKAAVEIAVEEAIHKRLDRAQTKVKQL